MPIDELVGDFAGHVIGEVAGWTVELVAEQIFSRYTARFFHSIGRRVIAIASLGGKRIPSSLRVVPAGTHPKPTTADWFALWVGVASWLLLATGVLMTLWHFH